MFPLLHDKNIRVCMDKSRKLSWEKFDISQFGNRTNMKI